MSLIPPSIWKPSAKDLATDLNPIQFAYQNGANAAAVAVDGILPVVGAPAFGIDKILLVTNVNYRATPGAGQSVTAVSLNLGFYDSAGAFVNLADIDGSGSIAPGVANFVSRSWQPGAPGFVLFADQTIRARGQFSAAGVANFMALFVQGIVVPRGNWQRS